MNHPFKLYMSKQAATYYITNMANEQERTL